MADELLPVEAPKPAYLSKTVWMNVVMAALAFIPGAAELIQANMEMYVLIWTGLATVLRMITKDKVVLW